MQVKRDLGKSILHLEDKKQITLNKFEAVYTSAFVVGYIFCIPNIVLV